MIQVPELELITGQEAAEFLQKTCNEQAKAGWHFYRVDQIPGTVKPGCLGGLFGAKETQHIMAVISFIRQG